MATWVYLSTRVASQSLLQMPSQSYLCLSDIHRANICLYCSDTEHILQFLGQCMQSGLIKFLNKTSTLKASGTMACSFMPSQSPMAFKQFHLLDFMMIFRPPTVQHSKLLLSRSYFHDKLTMVRFKPRSPGQHKNFAQLTHRWMLFQFLSVVLHRECRQLPILPDVIY